MSDIQQVLAELASAMRSEYAGREPCGDGILSSLQAATKNASMARMLHRLANENINAVPYQAVDPKWLQLYTDAAILETLAELSMEVSEAACFAGVRRLDMAIIVAGGGQRLPLIHTLLCSIQQHLPRPHNESRLHERPLPPDNSHLYAPLPIKEIVKPSIETFLTQSSSSPFVIRNYIGGGYQSCPRWPALDKWPSGAYLLGVAGPGRVVPVELGRAYDEEGWTQEIIAFDDFLQRAGFLDGTVAAVYLAQYSLFRQLPELQNDISIPDFAWSQPESTYPGYRPPSEPQLNVWVGSGSRRIISPPHTDPFFNCYVQVVGYKRVWLAPPLVTSGMEGYSVESEEGSVGAKEYMGNTSRVPIMKVEPEEVWKAHPGFKDKVYPHGREAVLGPGDMLFLPPGWWHSMRGEGNGPGWSVSIWY